jgi:hypothetical protein
MWMDVKFTNGVGRGREEKGKNQIGHTEVPFATLFFFLWGTITPPTLIGVAEPKRV